MPSDVDIWLKRETPRIRHALESASKYFNGNDALTVNTLEAMYARESSFGTMLGTRGSAVAAGHFHLRPKTAKRYHLSVSKENDQRFNIEYAASAAARYMKDLDSMFSTKVTLFEGRDTVPVTSVAERKKFALAAYSSGEGRIAKAQQLAEQAGKDPRSWVDVGQFLEAAGDAKTTAVDTRQYVEKVPIYESEFASKSPANKRLKQKDSRPGASRCTEGHWVTIDHRPVFICA